MAHTLPYSKEYIAENLDKAIIDAYVTPVQMLGKPMPEVSSKFTYRVVKQTSNECVMIDTLDEGLHNVEFRATNHSPDEDIYITSMGYEKVE